MGTCTTWSSLLAAALTAVLAILLPPQPLAADQPGADRAAGQPLPPFRSSVDLVNVDVAVIDREGRFVGDLRPEDFEVFDNGKRQEISAFAVVDAAGERRTAAAPEAPGDTATPPPDIGTNVASDVGGSIYIVVLDDLHVQPTRSARAQEIARRFVEGSLRPGDLAAIVHTSGRDGASQDLTTNRQLLQRSIDRFAGQGLRSSMLDRLEEYDLRETRESDRADQRFNQVQDPYSMIRAEYARRTLTALTKLGDLLSSTGARRKAVVFVSEGIAYDLQPKAIQTGSGLTAFTGGAFPDVLQEVRQAVRAAAAANIAIYGIDPRGLAAPGEDAIDVTSFPANPLLGITPEAFQKEVTQAQDSLRVLSDLTGGAASVASNDFNPILDRIVADASRYYLLGYRPGGQRNDGRYHPIEVRVKRSDVQVRARQGYVARAAATPPPGLVTEALEPSAALRDALNSPIPVTGLPLRVFAAPFKGGRGASVSMGIEIDAAQFAFAEQGGLYTDTVNVAVVAVDERGRFAAGDRYTVALKLKPDTHDAVRRHGIRVLFRLDLPGGRFQLRAAAHEAGGGAVGGVTYDIEVPSFDYAPLAMSGLVLTTPAARLQPTARNDANLSQTLPTPPTTMRTFAAGDSVTVFFEVYGDAQADLRVEASVRRGDGPPLVIKQERATAVEIRNGGGGVGFAIPMSLSGLTAGTHVLRVAVGRAGDGSELTRELPIEVLTSQ